jgi:hypothetical protein
MTSDPSRRDELTTGANVAAATDVHADARRVAEAVLRKEGRRVRTLATLAIGLWVASVFLIASVFLPAAAQAKKAAVELTRPPVPGQVLTAQQLADTLAPLLLRTFGVVGLMLGMALLTALLASISTVALALTIRRFTLRQVSASLAEISAQLRSQQSPRPTP